VRKSKGEDGREYEKILYIGKATSLRDRVRSYFNKDIVNTRSPLISKMLEEFTDIEHTATDSVLEALVLEAYLIKKHQPEANIKEKDNRSFNFVVITNEDFPEIVIVRARELLQSSSTIYRRRTGKVEKVSKGQLKNEENIQIAYSFGPFPNGSQLKEAMKMIRRMFPYRDEKCLPAQAGKAHSGRPCFNYQIGLCPGTCVDAVSREEYAKTIENIILFFEGGKKRIIKNLEKQMQEYAEAREFEKAEKIKRTMFTLNHIQDISLIKDDLFRTAGPDQTTMRIESYDIAHMSGQNVVGVMTVVEDGEAKKSDYRKFRIKNDPGVNDTKALSEVLSRRLAHIEWQMPNLIVVDGGVAQKRAMEKILRDNGVQIPVVSVVKDEHHRPKEILGDKKWLAYERAIILSNAEAHRYGIAYHKSLRERLP
jgi:excinuclease ABC subunit C